MNYSKKMPSNNIVNEIKNKLFIKIFKKAKN
jgi:hypothetical protein